MSDNPYIVNKFPDMDVEFIRQQIRQYIRMHHEDAITPNVANLMSVSLTRFVTDAVAKFAKGQKEHGGDLRTRDLSRELRNEHIDSFWYSEAGVWPEYLQ